MAAVPWCHRPIVAMLLAAACGTSSDLPWDSTADLTGLLPDLVVGMTTREQALLMLGLPMERFESDRILAWRMVANPLGEPQIVSQFVSPWYGTATQADYTFVQVDPRVRLEADGVRSLILAFDDRGVLLHCKLLRQR